MCVHHLQTGNVSIKPTHYSLKKSEKLRFPSILLESRWLPPMPINVYVIDHPEGLILIDAGESTRALTKDYYPSFIFRRILRINITPQEETTNQLQNIGFSPEQVRWVVLTKNPYKRECPRLKSWDAATKTTGSQLIACKCCAY